MHGSDAEVDLRARYARDGYVVVPGLIPTEDLTDALVAIDRLLAMKCPAFRQSDPQQVAEEIHAKLLTLAREDRAALGVVYDAIRKVLPFWTILGAKCMSTVVRQLLGTDSVGLAFRGSGIRLDLPNEDRWRSTWHQEYHSQVSSPTAVVAWFSLVPVSQSMGPVELAEGSHREGILPVRAIDPFNRGRDYTQTFEIPEVEGIASRYPQRAFETRPGDVVFIDFRTLHQSGVNRSSDRSRVTCQARYFDMADPTSVRHGWVGGWQDGHDFTRLHPELCIPDYEKLLPQGASR